jgi:hypothetical protein
MSSNKETIDRMRKALAESVTDWKEDGYVPPNFVRETGLGEEVARVDVWCGGFQHPHDPVTVGWKVQVGNQSMSGVLLVSDFTPAWSAVTPTTLPKDMAVAEAKALADEALASLKRQAA